MKSRYKRRMDLDKAERSSVMVFFSSKVARESVCRRNFSILFQIFQTVLGVLL
jgi:hypothetical protein